MIMIIPFKLYLAVAGSLFAASLSGRNVSADRIVSHHSNQQRDSIVTQDLCHAEVLSYSYRWTIDNFSHYTLDIGKPIWSPIFPPDANHKHMWRLAVYPNGDSWDNEDFLTVGVRLDGENNDVSLPVSAKIKISIINSTNQDTIVDGGSNEVEFTKIKQVKGRSRLIRRDILYDAKSGMLPGDKLTFTCKIDVFTGKFTEAPINTCRVLNDLGDILESQLLSDVDIVVAGREFKAHKAILAARSPVFRAMFSHDMQENQLGRVEVRDIEPEVFEQLLRFIYTGNSTRLESNIDKIVEDTNTEGTNRLSFAMELLSAACQYQLDDLKLTCEDYLSKGLSVESVVEILSIVDEYQMAWLKSRAVEFAMSHAEELTRMGAWNVLAEQSPKVLADLLTNQWSAATGQQSSSSNTD